VFKEMETLTRLFITTLIVFVSLLDASSKTASVNDSVELRPYPFAGNESSAMALCRSKANKPLLCYLSSLAHFLDIFKTEVGLPGYRLRLLDG
jgi:hypothetical protein